MKPLYIIGLFFLFLFFLSVKTKRDETNLKNEGLYPPDGNGTMDHVKSLMAKGYKIQAIKIYRQIHNVGLKEAKEAVEKLAEEQRPM